MSECENEWLGSAVRVAENKAKAEADKVAEANAREEERMEETKRQEAVRQAKEQKELEERKMEEQRAAAALTQKRAIAEAKRHAKDKAKRKANMLTAFLKTHESTEVRSSVSSEADINSNPSEFVLSSNGLIKYRGAVPSLQERQEQQEKDVAMKAGVIWLNDNISEMTRPQVRTLSAKTGITKKRRRTSFNRSLSVRGGTWARENPTPPTALVHPEQQMIALKREVSSLSTMLREQKRLSVAKRFPI